ncbi:MAG: RsmE family RNA methyltransferase [Dehalococcoidia bacterium]
MNRIYVLDFFKNDLAIIENKPQVHKIKNVLRLKKSDQLEVFDQHSNIYTTEIDQIKDSKISLNILKKRIVNISKYKINLAVAFPKGKRGDWIIEKATELGVDSIFILETDRSIMNAGIGRIKKWQQIAIHAAEQSGRTTIPAIKKLQIKEIDGIKIAAVINATKHLTKAINELQIENKGNQITYFVGPEGDWTEQEIKQIEDLGSIPVSLGSKVLRVETASIVGVYSLCMWRDSIDTINQTMM